MEEEEKEKDKEDKEEREQGVADIDSRHSHFSCYFFHNLSFNDIKGCRVL